MINLKLTNIFYCAFVLIKRRSKLCQRKTEEVEIPHLASNNESILVDGRDALVARADHAERHDRARRKISIRFQLKFGPRTHQDHVLWEVRRTKCQWLQNFDFDLVLELTVAIKLELVCGFQATK